jgi:signal transduction histidine kinase
VSHLSRGFVYDPVTPLSARIPTTAALAAPALTLAEPLWPAHAPLAYSDALIDGLPSGILVIDRDYRIQRVNRYTARWLKREPAEMVGQLCYRLVHGLEAPCQDCPCAVSFRTGEPATTVHTGLDAHGGTTHAELVSLPIRDASGQVVLALETARDVSERVRHVEELAAAVAGLEASQEQLRRRNEELEILNALLLRSGATRGLDAVLAGLLSGALRAVGGQASAAILLLDDSGRRLELMASQGLAGAFAACPVSLRAGECGCAQAALDGTLRVSSGCSGRPAARGADAAGGRIAVPLSSGGQVLGVLVIHLSPGQLLPPGREQLFELMGRQMGIAVENAQLYQRTDAQLHRKVGELTVALAEVERERGRALASERAKEEFVSMVAHDLRSPLSVILSDASDHGRTCQEEGCAESRHSIRRSVRRAAAMLTEVVDSARLEAGGLQLQRLPLDLAALVREVVEVAVPVDQRGRLRLSLPAAPAPVLGDRSWLERAIANVVGNALKFAPVEEPVTLQLARDGGAVRLEVVDQGPGIPAEDLPRLFQRYFRASNAQRIGGSGLGLYITRLVVEAHGGQVAARSELGYGSTITLTLPAHDPARPAT